MTPRADVPLSAVWPGRPYPLGATWDGQGVNFAIFSEHADRADLCLFDRPCGFAENGDSRDFIRLLAHSKPREVLINGAPMVFDSAIVREQEQA